MVLSLFVLCKVQLCGRVNLVVLLSMLIVHKVNKMLNSRPCYCGIINQALKQNYKIQHEIAFVTAGTIIMCAITSIY